MKRLLLLPLLLLMGAEPCSGTTPPPPKPQGFCKGMEGTVNSVVEGVKGTWAAIIGGYPAEDRHSTVYVGIVGVGSCSGTILNEHTVLTAGHCNGPNGYHIYPDRTGDPATYFVANGYLIHPGYSRWSANRGEPHDDLMLLYFDEELPGPYPAGIYDGADATQNAACDRTFGQGWGQTERSDAPPPEGYTRPPCPDGLSRCLQEGALRVFAERATDINSRLVNVWNYGGICFGDSGGPLYAQLDGETEPRLAGALSTTSSSNCVGGPTPPYTYQAYGTHVKLSAYKDWITANMR